MFVWTITDVIVLGLLLTYPAFIVVLCIYVWMRSAWRWMCSLFSSRAKG